MSQTADRYAKAFFELSREEKTLEAVESSLTDIRKIILDLVAFRQFLKNPLLSYEERCAVLKALFEGKVPDLTYKFLLFVTFKGRLSILKEIIESFDDLYLVSTNRVRAYVRTASPLDIKERILINQRLRDKFQHDMLTRWDTDPSLIGGFRIFSQGKVYDYTFKNQLNHFYQQMIQPT